MAAAETRAKIIEKLQEEMATRITIENSHQEKLDLLTEKIDLNHSQTNQSIAALDKKLVTAIEMLSVQVSKAMERTEYYNRDKPILGSFSPSEQAYSGKFVPSSSQSPVFPATALDSKQTRNRTEGENNNNSYSVQPLSYRFEFPRFDGSNPRSWLLKALNYFKIMNISDHDRVVIASMHFDGKAMEWYYQISQDGRMITWEQFMVLVSNQFGELKETRVFTDLCKLKVMGSLEEYIEKFQELKSHLLMFQRGNYDELFFINSFLSGLTEEMRQCFAIYTPPSLAQTIDTARMHEATMEGAAKRNRTQTRSSIYSPNVVRKGYSNPTTVTPEINSNPHTLQPTRKLLSTAEMRARREKGLCYNCEEQFTPGHKCKKSHMFFLMSEEEETEYMGATKSAEPPEEVVELSFHAMAGSAGVNTIKVQGLQGKQKLTILIDTGCTSSFISEPLAYEMGCEVIDINPISIQIADGNRMKSNKIVPNFTWEMKGEKFSFSLRLLKLGGYHIVLGCDWLREVAPVQFDHRDGSVMVLMETKCLRLSSIDIKDSYSLISADALYKLLCCDEQQTIEHLFSIQTDSEDTQINPAVSGILAQFDDVFIEPKDLPPVRGVEHSIILKEGSVPKQMYPYRYSHAYKDEIEKIVQELLDNGTIRHIQSSFASPVLLVRKKDSTWRMCVDYRYLNSLTIKHDYPIPVIDELLDELHGAQWFSKLDLRSGYFQIRMKDEDVDKTAFKTHHGHYEFLVMPFGLCNAPATFQSLMNQVFSQFLRKFILVFFDDILIYSNSLEEHISHLELTLSTLRIHQLYAKMSKCQFAQQQIEYLGHIISSEGVATDPTKIQCMLDWPRPNSVKGLRGFLGLTGYYRKFIRNYGLISKPLTDMLKKGCFTWTEASDQAFQELKTIMTTSPVLALPDFTKKFVVETDACSTGLGAVLMQDSRPIAFISKALSLRNQNLSIYEKEFMAVLLAVQKWKHYLQGAHFIIRTDQQSIKYIMEQKVTTALQQRWISKLIGLDYEIQYKKGAENKVADALSRQEFSPNEFHAMTIYDQT